MPMGVIFDWTFRNIIFLLSPPLSLLTSFVFHKSEKDFMREALSGESDDSGDP